MYMDVDEVAYPEGHTLWDKVIGARVRVRVRVRGRGRVRVRGRGRVGVRTASTLLKCSWKSSQEIQKVPSSPKVTPSVLSAW